MRILLTGNKGFVGSHIWTALKQDRHKIVGLDANPSFKIWHDEMNAIMDSEIEAVIHAGAISNNQSQDHNVYLWNTYATKLIAQRAREKTQTCDDFVFIFFSSCLVGETADDWNSRSPAIWSKAIAEEEVLSYLPNATILRPAVIWGNETNKVSSRGSVPWQLATHTLEYLFTNRSRSYVHVTDVVQAVKDCLDTNRRGIWGLHDAIWSNQQLASLVEWKGYKIVDDPIDVGHKYNMDHLKYTTKILPDWKPNVVISDELPRLEKEANG